MPLFECSQCGAVDNTAISGYWEQQFDAMQSGSEFKPKCSECHTGQWHGEFPKQLNADLRLIKDKRGFLQGDIK